MGLLSGGMTFLTDTLAASEGVSVTYTPLGGSATPLVAVPADVPVTVVQQQSREARLIRSERFYQIARGAWVEAFGTAVPREGDRVAETIHGTAATFEVAARDGEPAWRWLDPERTCLQVHTKPV